MEVYGNVHQYSSSYSEVVEIWARQFHNSIIELSCVITANINIILANIYILSVFENEVEKETANSKDDAKCC